jgi:diaminohydroxyphosphoribosylaminopyrimidine deaminase/5-amino-6-(5-phosphoribosylamino)uracil reductase
MEHEDFMREALKLAEKGMGFVSPNPMVGAVIVRDGRIIASGYHKKYGDLHAERSAFSECDEKGIDCRGADMYVTLEPCCHHGKQPPCTEAVIAHGIKRVFVGSNDPNPLVAGKGTQILRNHGIEVTEGVLKEDCDRLNEIFFKFITTGLPFVTLKYAMTLDGKIACYTGQSKWVTGEKAREHVHHERLRHAAIMVGVGTVLADDPMLTCRIENGRDPLRIICDTNLRMPLDSNIVRTADKVPTMIVCGCDDSTRINQYEKAGCRVVRLPSSDSGTDLKALMELLGKEKIDSVLIEGGGTLGWSALKNGIVDRVTAYVAPKIFGGAEAKSPVEGQGVECPAEAFILTDRRIKELGDDILIEGQVKKCLPDL